MRRRKISWWESGILFVVDALITYAMLRWIWGVPDHVSAPVAWLSASFWVQIYSIQTWIGMKA